MCFKNLCWLCSFCISRPKTREKIQLDERLVHGPGLRSNRKKNEILFSAIYINLTVSIMVNNFRKDLRIY